MLGRKPEIVNCSKVSSILELLSLQYLRESKVGDLSLDGGGNQWISLSLKLQAYLLTLNSHRNYKFSKENDSILLIYLDK